MAIIVAMALFGMLWTPAPASGEINVAGLYVDYGDGRLSYAVVPFQEDSISGLDLLERSGLDLLTIDIGGMGAAICEIGDVGCDVSACRTRMCQTGDPESPFWRSMVGEDGETWRFSTRGASSSTVEDGDVYGWFWASDDPAGLSLSLDALAAQLDIDLEDTRQTAPGELHATLVTLGGEPNGSDPTSAWQLITGGAALAIVAALGGLALYRSRPRGAP